MRMMMMLGLASSSVVFFLDVLLGLFSVSFFQFFNPIPIFKPIHQNLEGLCNQSDDDVVDDLLLNRHSNKPDLLTCACSPFLILFNRFNLSFYLILFDCGSVKNSGAWVFSVWPDLCEVSFLIWIWIYFEALFLTNWQRLVLLSFLAVLHYLKLFLLNLEPKFKPGCCLSYRILVCWSSTFSFNLILLPAEATSDLRYLLMHLSFLESKLSYQISVLFRGLFLLLIPDSSWFTEPDLTDSLSYVATFCLDIVYHLNSPPLNDFCARVSFDIHRWWHQHLSHSVSTCVELSFVHLYTSDLNLYFLRRTKFSTPHLFLTPNQWTSTYYLGGQLESLFLESPRFFNRLQQFHLDIGSASLLRTPGLVTMLVNCHNFTYWLFTGILDLKTYKANWMVFSNWKNFGRGFWMVLLRDSYISMIFLLAFRLAKYISNITLHAFRLVSFLCIIGCVLFQLVKCEGLTWISINPMKIWQDEEDVWFH